MSHYFENDINLKDQERRIQFEFKNKKFDLLSNTGVFCKDKLDTGTKILLDTILKEETEMYDVLDLGCGIGVVGVVLSSFYDCQMTMIDINERAISLARYNIKLLHKHAKVMCQDGITEGMFDCIVLNPPIRAGKAVIYSLFDQSISHLRENGRFWIVMRKQHGAQSAMNYLASKGCEVKKIKQDKGFWIIKVQNVL